MLQIEGSFFHSDGWSGEQAHTRKSQSRSQLSPDDELSICSIRMFLVEWGSEDGSDSPLEMMCPPLTGSGCSRSTGASSTQTAGLEVWSLSSVDLPPLSSESSGSSVFTEQAHTRKWQNRCQLSPDDELMCPPLPGQVPVEPTVTSTGLTAQGAVEASPANRSSAGKPRKRKGIRSFLRRVWKAMRHHFSCCCHCSAVDDVEPFTPPADLDPEH